MVAATPIFVPDPRPLGADPTPAGLPDGLDLGLVSRRPARLTDATAAAAAALPVPAAPPGPAGPPRASVIVVTFNNLPFTKLCLASLLANTNGPAYEVIVVDNASADGTPAYLDAVATANPHVRVIRNDTNLGFAPANNQGLAAARGDVLVLLNNDTIVPPAWLAGLARHLTDPAVGLVGPVTNRIGNEAEVATDYRTYGEMLSFARQTARASAGRRSDLPTPCMFCLAMRRDAFARLGPLDERYEVGLLEDDDYAARAHAAAYETACAEDVFVHHFGQASFGGLVPTGEYGRLLAANKRRFEEKWGAAWRPYGRRTPAGYAGAARRVRDVVRRAVPPGARVLVVSKGDEGLLAPLRDDGRTALHFPHGADGGYAGHYPADSAGAIAMLEDARAAGADLLVFPAAGAWWLDHYGTFRQHLDARYRRVAADDGGGGDGCVAYHLRGTERSNPDGSQPRL